MDIAPQAVPPDAAAEANLAKAEEGLRRELADLEAARDSAAASLDATRREAERTAEWMRREAERAARDLEVVEVRRKVAAGEVAALVARRDALAGELAAAGAARGGSRYAPPLPPVAPSQEPAARAAPAEPPRVSAPTPAAPERVARATPADPDPTAPPAVGERRTRVFVHYSALDARAAARARAAAAALEARGFPVADLRAMPYGIVRDRVRFFHAEDAGNAAPLRAALAPVGGAEAAVQDFSGFRPPPSLGTLEVWLAGSGG